MQIPNAVTMNVEHIKQLCFGCFLVCCMRRAIIGTIYVSNNTCLYLCSAPFQNGTCNSDSATSSSVDLYWSSVKSVTYYQISYSEMIVQNVSSTNVNVTQLTAGYLYTFYLQSFGPGGSDNKTNCSYSTCKLTIYI